MLSINYQFQNINTLSFLLTFSTRPVFFSSIAAKARILFDFMHFPYLLPMHSGAQRRMKEATHGSAYAPAMLQTFGFPRCFASLHPHVWAFAKVYAQLERARLVVDFGSLLHSYLNHFIEQEFDIHILHEQNFS